jgi:glutathione peroxidase-family protein
LSPSPLSFQDATGTDDIAWNFDRYYVVSRTGEVTWYNETPLGLENVIKHYLFEDQDL